MTSLLVSKWQDLFWRCSAKYISKMDEKETYHLQGFGILKVVHMLRSSYQKNIILENIREMTILGVKSGGQPKH